jgi:hypothetical protein
MYDGNMEGYPGCAAEFELQSVQVNGTEIIEIISDEVHEEIIDKVLGDTPVSKDIAKKATVNPNVTVTSDYGAKNKIVSNMNFII